MCTDMRADMRVDMRIGTYANMCMDMQGANVRIDVQPGRVANNGAVCVYLWCTALSLSWCMRVATCEDMAGVCKEIYTDMRA